MQYVSPMLSFLPHALRGVLVTLLIGLNTLFWCTPLLAIALLKFVVPLRVWRDLCTRALIAIATAWVSVNSALFGVFHGIHWVIHGLEGLAPDDWYLVTCNHQSWADIPVVQKVLNRRIPMLKFFLKEVLIWVPVLGLAWWALDFPFMKRYSREQVRANPKLGSVDLERTRRVCEKFRTTPVSVFNFAEGTRFSEAKHARQESPYTHLLKPRAGGAAFVLGALGDQVRTVLDVTVVYPQGQPRAWDLLAGHLHTIVVDVRTIPIPEEFLGRDYAGDAAFRAAFQTWIGELWRDKDARIAKVLATSRA
jgi:1-acyl-sn-glycerol-3-phosphate acyltransferase